MAAKQIYLRDLHKIVRDLDRLVTDARAGGPPRHIDFSAVRKYAAAITAMVADDEPSSPHAATATQPPKAATDNDKSAAKERAEYGRAAADKKPFDPTILGLYHIHKG